MPCASAGGVKNGGLPLTPAPANTVGVGVGVGVGEQVEWGMDG